MIGAWLVITVVGVATVGSSIGAFSKQFSLPRREGTRPTRGSCISSTLAAGPQTDVKVSATGLAAGIMLDATVMRALLVPAVVSLLGR